MHDHKLVKCLLVLLLLPLVLAFFSGDRFRYPCQDPENWDKEFCKLPKCDVTRTCPEHIFKGQRDPRIGPPKDETNKTDIKPMGLAIPTQGTQGTQGGNCGK